MDLTTGKHEMNGPNWNLIDEISIPLLETGVGTVPLLQAALPSVLSMDVLDENVTERYRKILRISQLQIQHLLRSQNELLRQMSRLEAEISKKHICNRKLSNPEDYSKFKCDDCGKIFLNENFLTSHFQRRHSKDGTVMMRNRHSTSE